MSADDRSPIGEIYDALRALNASWSVDVGRPSGSGWIAGTELRVASTGPFNELLLRIGEHLRTRTIREQITRQSQRSQTGMRCCERSGASS
jgi:hypothetical protein